MTDHQAGDMQLYSHAMPLYMHFKLPPEEINLLTAKCLQKCLIRLPE